jgi:hypothetical protein
MKTSSSFLILSIFLLPACSHYSSDLSALEEQMGTTTYVAVTDAPALDGITPAAGMETPAIPFHTILAQEYLALAKANEAAMDYKTARYFTEKAAAAMAGKPVAPGTPTQFGIARDKSQTLNTARAELIGKLQNDMVPANYAALAKAQTQYDSWLDDVQDSKGDKGLCQDGFNEAMAQLTAAMSADMIQDPALVPAATPVLLTPVTGMPREPI